MKLNALYTTLALCTVAIPALSQNNTTPENRPCTTVTEGDSYEWEGKKLPHCEGDFNFSGADVNPMLKLPAYGYISNSDGVVPVYSQLQFTKKPQ